MTKKKTTTTEIKIVSDADKHAFEDRDPFEELARHRTNHPNESVPSELEFAAIVEPGLTPSVNVEAIVDGQIAEESGPGRRNDADRIARCRRMDELIENSKISNIKASPQLESELSIARCRRQAVGCTKRNGAAHPQGAYQRRVERGLQYRRHAPGVGQ